MNTRRGGQTTTTKNNGSNSSDKPEFHNSGGSDFSKNQSEGTRLTSPVTRMPPNQKDAPSTMSTSRRPRSYRSRQSSHTNSYSKASRTRKPALPKVSTVRSIDSDTVGSNSEKYLSIPEDERKPAAVETINKNRPRQTAVQLTKNRLSTTGILSQKTIQLGTISLPES